MTNDQQRIHNSRVFAVAQSRWEEPPDDMGCGCAKLACPECRSEVGEHCDGCEQWVLKEELVQSPDPECVQPFLECPKCAAETMRLRRTA